MISNLMSLDMAKVMDFVKVDTQFVLLLKNKSIQTIVNHKT